jgi:nitroimidazol reductase NimA-like FMN-containing flavoprotein (pyridoxamine 5'-phosphate oxidase superfamily)
MATTTGPRFRELSSDESHALLASKKVGRIAFTFHDKVDIEPINYVSDGEWIFGRTSMGTKLATLLHHPGAPSRSTRSTTCSLARRRPGA